MFNDLFELIIKFTFNYLLSGEFLNKYIIRGLAWPKLEIILMALNDKSVEFFFFTNAHISDTLVRFGIQTVNIWLFFLRDFRYVQYTFVLLRIFRATFKPFHSIRSSLKFLDYCVLGAIAWLLFKFSEANFAEKWKSANNTNPQAFLTGEFFRLSTIVIKY